MSLLEQKDECLKELPIKLINYVRDKYNGEDKSIELSHIEKYSIMYLWFGINVKNTLIKVSMIANSIFKEYMNGTGQDSWDKLITALLASEYFDKLFNLAFYDVCSTLYLEIAERSKAEEK